ncbi:MAG: DinB family protein [Acidimicrobiales bacterium]
MPCMDQCADCGFTYDLTRAETAGEGIASGVSGLAAILSDPSVDSHRRRQPEQWSPLEYGCHVRDVLTVQRERVLHTRRADRPRAEPMGRDERVDHDGYAEQNPEDVARQLIEAARLFAHVLARLDASGWERTLIYTYPEVAERSLRWVAVHTQHEVQHHVLDVQRQLAATG